MILSWYKKRSTIKKSKELLDKTNNILSKHKEFLNPEVASEADKKVRESENAIRSGGLKEIKRTYNSLLNFNKKNFGSYEKSKLRQNLEVLIFALALAF